MRQMHWQSQRNWEDLYRHSRVQKQVCEQVGEESDLYERARVQANKETALEALRKAYAALQTGDTDMAVRPSLPLCIGH